jgi:hypothetical protein
MKDLVVLFAKKQNSQKPVLKQDIFSFNKILYANK